MGIGVLRSGLWNGVSDALSVVFYRVSIIYLGFLPIADLRILIDVRILEESLGPFDQARAGESLIGQNEKNVSLEASLQRLLRRKAKGSEGET